MAKKPTLTLDDHKRIGKQLCAIRSMYLDIDLEIRNAFPKSHRAGRKAVALYDAIDSLRCALDGVVCGMAGGGPRIYYPGPTESAGWERENQT